MSYLNLDPSKQQLNERKWISVQGAMMHITLIEMCHMLDLYLDGCHKIKKRNTT